jgi:hypothetical protein
MVKIHYSIGWIVYLLVIVFSCQNPSPINNEFYFFPPEYNQVMLKASSDTLKFAFPDTLYYKIQAFNVFTEGNNEFISFFDSKEIGNKKQSILIYNFENKKLITRIPITRFITNSGPFYTSVFIKGFDSIFIFDETSLRLFDSAGKVKHKIDLLGAKPQMGFYNTGNPPVFCNSNLYMGVKPPVSKITFESLINEHVIYKFDFKTNDAKLIYSFPAIYYKQYFGYPLLHSSYCYNDSNRFVFSFAADTNIYETDFEEYNRSYFGKSRMQKEVIKPLTKLERTRLEENSKNYFLNDSYGQIYFDRSMSRYLRVILHKITTTEYEGKGNKVQSVLILDRGFRVIGESYFPAGLDMRQMFFSSDGSIYTQVIRKSKSDIEFVRLVYE